MSSRLRELIDRVCGTRGPIASTLSASEWHELREELEDLDGKQAKRGEVLEQAAR